ncbi:MAG: hypothetical protein AAGA29_01590 [Planctomycetota bacterium]
MKTGLAICAFIVATVTGLSVLELREPIDIATDATHPDKLLRVELSDELPDLFIPEGLTASEADFASLSAACDNASSQITEGDEQTQAEHADAVCAALLDALSAGSFEAGFADRLVPPFDLFSDELRLLFRVTLLAVNHRLARLLEEGAHEEADQLARAHFELGRRVFAQNTRLRVRQHGLGLMHAGLTQARQVLQAQSQDEASESAEPTKPEQDLAAWEQAVTTIDTAWREKLDWISSARPNVADLIRVAEEDQDRSFRVYATHQLGYARFECGEPGNQRMIAQAIGRAGESDDPLIRQAARFAQRMNREQFYAATP